MHRCHRCSWHIAKTLKLVISSMTMTTTRWRKENCNCSVNGDLSRVYMCWLLSSPTLPGMICSCESNVPHVHCYHTTPKWPLTMSALYWSGNHRIWWRWWLMPWHCVIWGQLSKRKMPCITVWTLTHKISCVQVYFACCVCKSDTLHRFRHRFKTKTTKRRWVS